MGLRVVGEECLEFLLLPTDPEVYPAGEFLLDDDQVVLVEVVGVLGLHDHEHEDGILEGGVGAPLRVLQLLVGNDQVDVGLHHLTLQDTLDTVQELSQGAVFVPKDLPLFSLVVLGLLEVLDELLQCLHLADVLDDEIYPLLNLIYLLLVGVLCLKLLQLSSELVDVETILQSPLPAGEETASGSQHPGRVVYPLRLVPDLLGGVVGIDCEVAAHDHVVEESEHDHYLGREQVQMGLHVVCVVALGLHDQPVQIDLAEYPIQELEVECLDLQPLKGLLHGSAQLPPFGVQQVKRWAVVPNALVLLLYQCLLQHSLVILGLPLESGPAQSGLKQLLHLNGVNLEAELNEVGLFELELLFDLVGAEVVEAEWVGGEVDAGVGGMVHEGLTLDLGQSAHSVLEGDALMNVLLQTPGHHVQQLRRIPVSLLDVDEIVEDLAAIEALEGSGEDHGVDVDSQEVDVGVLLHLPQLFTGVLLEPVLALGDELHDFEGSGVLHVEPSADVAVVRVTLDEGRVEVRYLDLLVVEEDVFGTQVAVDDAAQLQLLQALGYLAAVLDHFVLGEGVLLLGDDAVDLLLQRPPVHLLQHEHDVLDALRPPVGELHDLVVQLLVLGVPGVFVGDAQHLDGPVAASQDGVAVELGGDLVIVLAFWVVVDDSSRLVQPGVLAVGHPADQAHGQQFEGPLALQYLAQVKGTLRVHIAFGVGVGPLRARQ